MILPNVSVIIPTYNRKHLILDALAQLRQQTLKEIEFIIIDDGSDDNSYDLLCKETEQDKRFIILKQEHQGPSVARNKGLSQAGGKYIGFFDIDDTIPNNYFAELYNIANKQNADIVYTSYNSIPHYLKSVTTRADRIKSLRNGAIWDKLYKREFIAKNHMQFAEELYTADNLWCIQAFSYAENIVLVDNPSYQYKLHHDSIGKDKTKINKRKNDIFAIIAQIKSFCDSVKYTTDEMNVLTKFLKRSYDCYPSDKEYSRKLYHTLGIEPIQTTKKNDWLIKMLLLKIARLTHIIGKDKYREKKYILLLENTPLFDKKWYLNRYPDVKNNPAKHYFKYGWKEGRYPSLLFDGNAYLEKNPDVVSYNICPLVHYLTVGVREGREYTSVPEKECSRKIFIPDNKKKILENMYYILTHPLRLKEECEYLKAILERKTKQYIPSSVPENTPENQIKEEKSKVVTVKNTEGDPNTKAEIIIQNNINYIPKVSVIIPVYNVEQYLRECLDSVVNQTLREIEIICIDDGSTDNSLEILKEYAAKDDRITILKQQNLYAGVARNAGLAVAKGKYLSFLDSDDFFELTLLEETYNIAEKEKSEIVFYKYTYYDDKLKTTGREAGIAKKYTNRPIYTTKTKKLKNDLFRICDHTPWNKLIKRELVTKEKIYFQPLRASNDTYFSFVVLACSQQITLYYKSLLYYRYDREGSLVNSRDKFPFGFYYAYTGVHHTLEKKSLFEIYKKTFLTSFISTALWTISKTDLRKEEVKELLRSKVIPEYEILGKNKKLIGKRLLGNFIGELSLDIDVYECYKPQISGKITSYIFYPYYLLQKLYLYRKYCMLRANTAQDRVKIN